MKRTLKILLAMIFILSIIAPTIRYRVKFLDGARNVKAVKVFKTAYDGSKINSKYLIKLVEDNMPGIIVRQARTDTTDLNNGIAVIKPVIVWSDTLKYLKIGKNITIKR